MRTNTPGRRIRGFAAVAALLAAGIGIAGSADAATVLFSDNFDGAPSGSALNTAPANWTVRAGTVDWINDSNSYGDGGTNLKCYGGAGCVDTDGSSNDAGIMVSNDVFTLYAGTKYVLEAYVSGNQRGTDYPSGGPDQLQFGFLDGNDIVIPTALHVTGFIGAGAAYSLVSLAFTPTQDYTGTRIFFGALLPTGSPLGDNVGLMLDNVSLTAVPLPAAAWLLLSGLVGLGAIGRRKANATA